MGRFTLSLPQTWHHELEVRAQNEGVSLNQYIVYTLTRQVASTYTIQVLPAKTINEQKESYAKLLDSLGDSSISAPKAFLAEREKGKPEEELTAEISNRLKEKMENK